MKNVRCRDVLKEYMYSFCEKNTVYVSTYSMEVTFLTFGTPDIFLRT